MPTANTTENTTIANTTQLSTVTGARAKFKQASIAIDAESTETLATFMYNIINNLQVNKNIIEVCDNYYLLYWSGEHFKANNINGVITREGKQFIIVFKHCTPAVVYKQVNIKLSFRELPEWISRFNYVLVSID